MTRRWKGLVGRQYAARWWGQPALDHGLKGDFTNKNGQAGRPTMGKIWVKSCGAWHVTSMFFPKTRKFPEKSWAVGRNPGLNPPNHESYWSFYPKTNQWRQGSTYEYLNLEELERFIKMGLAQSDKRGNFCGSISTSVLSHRHCVYDPRYASFGPAAHQVLIFLYFAVGLKFREHPQISW